MGDRQDNQIAPIKLYILMGFMLLTGSANTILMKLQDGTSAAAPNYGYNSPVSFNQPFWQCAVMFVGEFMCLGFYWLKCYL